MKRALLVATLLVTLLSKKAEAQQVSFKTEFIGNSGYWFLPNGDKPKERIGDGKGSAIIYQGAFTMPLSLKMNENNRPTIWGVGLSGAYASLNNKNFEDEMVSKIMNLQVGVYHLRPFNDRWSMRASVGVGVFTPSANLVKIRFKNVLGSASNNDYYFAVSPYASVGLKWGFKLCLTRLLADLDSLTGAVILNLL